MDQELIAYLDKRFGETAQQIQGFWGEFKSFRAETAQRFERVEESIWHSQASVGEAQGDIRAVALGIIILDEKLESVQRQIEQEFEDARNLIFSLNPPVVHIDLEGRDPIKYIKERILGRPPE
jgi:hypothetical protein